MKLVMDNRNTTIAYYAGALGLVYAIFNWDWNLFVMALAIHFVLISIFSAVTHRYFSHRAFAANPHVMWCLAALTVCYSYASPINWSYLHLAHHRYANTDKDSHIKGLRGFLTASYKLPDKKFLVPGRWFSNQQHLFLHNNAVLFVLGFGLLSALVSMDFFVWGYLLPIFFLHFGQGFHKTFSHNKDSATNHWWLEFIVPMGGEWLHHKHHDIASDAKFKNKWYEFDAGWLIVKMLKQDGVNANTSS